MSLLWSRRWEKDYLSTLQQELYICASDSQLFKKKEEAATLSNSCLGHSFSQDLKHAAQME